MIKVIKASKLQLIAKCEASTTVRARNLKQIKRCQRSACDFDYVTRNVNCYEIDDRD